MAELTVLMPVYNAEKYLKESIDSILGQIFTDFEFLIIDDGSTDKSVNIIKSYNDDRIRLICNVENMGISKTLNRGIELANTDLIARMDADDISLPDRLKKQYNFMVKNPEIKLLSTTIERISEIGKTISRSSSDFNPLYFQLIFHCFGIYHPTVMYRKEAVVDVGMYPETHSEDFCLWSKMIRKYRFYHMSEILVKYRLSEQSISHTTLREAYSEDELTYARENLKYFMGEDYTISDSWLKAYRNEIQPIMESSDYNEMAQCIHELDNITQRVIKKENVNKNLKNILEAANIKKKQLLERLSSRLSALQGCILIIKAGYPLRLPLYLFPDLFAQGIKNFVGKIKRIHR